MKIIKEFTNQQIDVITANLAPVKSSAIAYYLRGNYYDIRKVNSLINDFENFKSLDEWLSSTVSA